LARYCTNEIDVILVVRFKQASDGAVGIPATYLYLSRTASRSSGRARAVYSCSLSQLAAIDPYESTEEAIGDWHYWLGQD
jgi:hypothetical protein